MKLTSYELAYVRSHGLYITEKCDACGKLLNQTGWHTITAKAGVYCSAVCRDFVFFGDRHEAEKQATPGRCAYCGATLQGKRRGALYCDHVCQVRAQRKFKRSTTEKLPISVTPAPLNEQPGGAKIAC